MGLTLCLSSAAILRCAPFTQIQTKVLIIPTALELIFSTALIFTNWGSGWRHLLLTAEGWIYFILALVDLFSHILPAVRDNLQTFKAVDKLLGVASSLPIVCYLLFIFLFTRSELLNVLPKRFQRIPAIALLLFIPAIIITNELGSFLGVNYRGGKPVSFGFLDAKGEALWSFFTSVTLALLVSFQAINFSLAFYRLIRALLSQRQNEEEDSRYKFGNSRYGFGEQGIEAQDKVTLYKGTGWICGGLKFGAIETIIGFVAEGGFGMALTRRILRLLSRAFIIIGLAKGLDTVEDFDVVRDELQRSAAERKLRQQSSMRAFISNPRFSTFRQLSPTATAFHSIPRAPKALATTSSPTLVAPIPTIVYPKPVPPPQYNRKLQKKDSRNTLDKALFTPEQAQYSDLPTLSEFARIRDIENGKRVTIRRESGGAPTLHMRLSSLDMPSPSVITESIRSRPNSEFLLASKVSKAPMSIIYADANGNVSMNEDDRNGTSTIEPPSTPFAATSLPATVYTSSFIQHPPTSTAHTSTTFSFLAPPPPSIARAIHDATPSLLLRTSIIVASPPNAPRPLPQNDTLANPWPRSIPHPYALSVADVPSRPPRSEEASSSDGTSVQTLISHTRGLPANVRPTRSEPSHVQQPESETGHSESTHSEYSQMSHQAPVANAHRSNSLTKRKPPPPVSPTILGINTDVGVVGTSTTEPRAARTVNSHSHTPGDVPKSAFPDSPPTSPNDTITPNPFGDEGEIEVEVLANGLENGYPAALNTGRSREFAAWKLARDGSLQRENSLQGNSLKRGDSKRSQLPTPDENDEIAADELRQRIQKDAMTIPWLRNPPKKDFEIQVADRVKVARIKSIGRAPRRSTPIPIRSHHNRESMHMSIETVPPTASSAPEKSILSRNSYRFSTYGQPKTAAEEYRDTIVSNRRSSSFGRRVLRDSEVLGIEDDSPITGRNPFGRN